MIQDMAMVTNGRQIGTRVQSIEWCHFQWPWKTPYPDFKDVPLFDI